MLALLQLPLLLALVPFSLAKPSPPSFVRVSRRGQHNQQQRDLIGGLTSLLAGGADPTSSSSASASAATSSTSTSPSGTSSTSSSKGAASVPASSSSSSLTSASTTASISSSPSASTTQASSSSSSDPLASASSSSSIPAASTSSSVVASSSATSGPSSSSSSAVSSSSKSQSLVYSTHTTVAANSDGSKTTSTSITTSLATVGKQNAVKSTGKTWAIVGGSVGGAVLLAAVIFIVMRCRHKRFSDDDGEDLRWPELQPQGQTVSAQASTLNPLGTRPTGRAGVEMSEGPGYAESYRGGRRSESLSSFEGFPERSMTGGVGGGYRQDAFLGASAAPYPVPPSIYPNIARQHSPANSFSGGPYNIAYQNAAYAPARTGTPLQTNVPLGGVSLGRNTSIPPVGSLRARNA